MNPHVRLVGWSVGLSVGFTSHAPIIGAFAVYIRGKSNLSDRFVRVGRDRVQYKDRMFFCIMHFFEVTLPYEPSCPSAGWLVCWLAGGRTVERSVCHNFLKKGGKLHFHAPIGAHVP